MHRGHLVVDDDARLPSGTELLQPGRTTGALVRLASASTDGAGIRTLGIKLPDVYGPGRDQDFLLASSADGAPLHHVTLPSAQPGSRLYSSLWLYLAGSRPILVGARGVAEAAHDVDITLSGVIGRFHRIGRLAISEERVDDDGIAFAARNTGGGLRPLPPVLFYRERSPAR